MEALVNWRMHIAYIGLVVAVSWGTASLFAQDWPEWRGSGRFGVWTETGILETFPEEGLTVRWRVPINAGYSGPAVAGGRVFVTDAVRGKLNDATERVLAIDEETGEVLWTHEWETDYRGLEPVFAVGPRATPTVDNETVYVLSTMGNLFAFETATGQVIWEKDFVREFNSAIPSWGMAGAPLVDGNRLICLVGGEPDAKVVAFDKRTGEELWRALSSDWEPGYNQPTIIEAGGTRQLIIWHPRAISALDPVTGEVHWEVPYQVDMGMTVATPVWNGTHLLVTSHYNGARVLQLNSDRPGARLLWGTEDLLSSTIGTPVIQGDYLYGVTDGEIRCIELATGRQIWASPDLLNNERSSHATAFFVRNGDRYFINNDRGELVIAKLSPEGFQEISRTKLIEPTHPPGRGRRELGAVHWSHPAYANKHIFVRNDNEIIRASLAQE